MSSAWIAATVLMLSPLLGRASEFTMSHWINSNRVHLGVAGSPEWDQFAESRPDARRLDLRFNAVANEQESSLFIRQDDVKQDWAVELNKKRIGKLFLMEADLVYTLPVTAGSLRDGENCLSIVPPRERDDIVLHEIRIDQRPLAGALREATLQVTVRDTDKRTLLPCRLTLVDKRGTLVPLLALTNAAFSSRDRFPLMATRPGVVYTGEGLARVGLPAGDYTVYASRGLEWSVATQHVRVAIGQSRQLTLELRREVSTPGLVSCDPHVHTFTFSGHGDASIEERMLTLAGEGIELPIATDHNIRVDYSEPAERLGVDHWFTPVSGNEVTTLAGHFNIFPVSAGARAPDFHITDWATLMAELRATPGVRVVVLNHPRNVHNGFQPFAETNYSSVTGENKRGPEFTFDAIEVLSSSAQQTDYMLVYRDWFGLLNYGYRVASVGSSDGHDVSRYIVGQGRTYIVCPDQDPGHINVATACANLKAGRAFVSMGLLTRVFVGKFGVGDIATGLDKQVRVNVEVSGPSWVSVTNISLFANGLKIRETEVKEWPHQKATHAGEHKVNVVWMIAKPAHDVHLVAIATGPPVSAPFWAIPRPYQPAAPHWEGRVIGSTNPIWLDADGDGRFSPARAYANQVLRRVGSDPAQLFEELTRFDEAVAAQAASLCTPAGQWADKAKVAHFLKFAAPHVRRGFAAFVATGD